MCAHQPVPGAGLTYRLAFDGAGEGIRSADNLGSAMTTQRGISRREFLSVLLGVGLGTSADSWAQEWVSPHYAAARAGHGFRALPIRSGRPAESYVYVDPYCSSCKEILSQARARSDTSAVFLPVAILDENSGRVAAAALCAPDPAAFLLQFPDRLPECRDTASLRAVSHNTRLLYATGAVYVPFWVRP